MKQSIVRSVSFNGRNVSQLIFTKYRNEYWVEVRGTLITVPGLVIRPIKAGSVVNWMDGGHTKIDQNAWVAVAYDFKDERPKLNLGVISISRDPKLCYAAAAAEWA